MREAALEGTGEVEAAIVAGSRRDVVSRASRSLARLWRTRTAPMRNPGPLVSFTFDDIPDTAFDNGARELEAAGARGTFYVAGGLCDKAWGPWRFVSADALPRLVDAGHEIGCHTFSHPDVQTLSPAEAAAEAARNRAFLRGIDPRIRLDAFAYPYGSVGLRQKPTVQALYRSCRGVRAGINVGRVDLGQFLAVRLYDHEISRDGVDRLIARAVARNGWLVFYTHDVAESPSAHGCTPGLLAYTVRRAIKAGCAVETVAGALDRIGVP